MGFQFGTKKKEEPKVEEKKEEDSSLVPGNENKEDWMTKKWRPMMAMMYMVCCLADFAIFPIMFTIVQFWEEQAVNDAFRQWVPITLQGGGLFHVAMGAVLGVSAFGRTQEKIAGAAGGVPTPTLSSAPPPPAPGTTLSAPRPQAITAAPMPVSQPMAYADPNPSVPLSQPIMDAPPSDGTSIRPIVRRPV